MSQTADLSAKDVYERSCNMFVYFLDWRHKLFAGYLASLAAIAVAFYNKDSYAHTLAGATIVLSIVFWIIDFRIRDLYKLCSEAAEKLESSTHGSFFEYAQLNKKFHAFRHSMAFDTLVLTVICFAGSYFVWSQQYVGAAVVIGLVGGTIPRFLIESHIFRKQSQKQAASKAARS